MTTVFAKVLTKNGNILLLLTSLLISSSLEGAKKFIFSRNFPALVACKTSKSVTEEMLQLLRQTLTVALTASAS